jgi:hypothetical protein
LGERRCLQRREPLFHHLVPLSWITHTRSNGFNGSNCSKRFERLEPLERFKPEEYGQDFRSGYRL